MCSLCLVAPVVARAEEVPHDTESGDRFDLWAHAETNALLFQRALLPGPDGTLVRTQTIVPVRQDLRLRARDLDVGWRDDSVDVEVAAWAAALPGDSRAPRQADGDVQTAFVRYRHGPVAVRLGRQHAAGSAARYVRFDGADVQADLGAGVHADAYGGFRVLPRWNLRPGYFSLGTRSRQALRDPNAVPAPERSDWWLAGGRLGWDTDLSSVGISFHDQERTGGVGRRNLGATALVRPLEHTTIGSRALVDVDSRRVADGRAWVDVSPISEVDLSVEYFHTNPSLLLSRQSVLSVFSTSAYDETGGTVVSRPFDFLSLQAGGWVQFYDKGHPGSRANLVARVIEGRNRRTLFRLGYTRVLAPDNGYHALRASLSRRLMAALTATLEAYGYFYDEAIRQVRTSSVYAAMLTWQAQDPLSILVGGSIARSPYAAADAQAQIRLAYDFDLSTRGPGR